MGRAERAERPVGRGTAGTAGTYPAVAVPDGNVQVLGVVVDCYPARSGQPRTAAAGRVTGSASPAERPRPWSSPSISGGNPTNLGRHATARRRRLGCRTRVLRPYPARTGRETVTAEARSSNPRRRR